ncbi:phage tail spike protein [Priestia endophytica]|uniref:phage tail spike protein n=1 Tax=Priestia endophytica TaxID=135735 RepID=UPI002040EE2C|nr:phage tail spike protein [Priestia endophytica]MCM3536603.1 hypothetical protein [Priestia endophytica]
MWHVLDQNYNYMGHINSKTLKGCPLQRDTRSETLTDGYTTLEFDVPSDHPTAKALVNGAFIVYTDETIGYEYELFRVIKPKIQTGLENVLTCLCETAATEDLRGTHVDPYSTTGRTLAQVLQVILQNTGWELGQCYFDELVDIDISNYPTALEAVRNLIANYGAEIEFKVIFSNLKIVKKVVNVYEKKGNQNTGITFTYKRNLKGLIKTVDRSQIATSVVVVASQQGADGKPLSIMNAQKALPKGYVKENNRIIDLNALKKYGNNGKNVEAKFIDQTATNAVALQDNGLAYLQKINKPIATWEADVEFMEGVEGYSHYASNVGDRIIIQDISTSEPNYVSARILNKTNSVKDPSVGSLTLGEYEIINFSPDALAVQTRDKLAIKEGQWNQAIEDAKQAQKDAEEAKNNVTYKLELSSSKGNVFRNGVVDTVVRVIIFKGNTDITSTVPAAQIVWKKYNADGSEDTAWNTAHKDVGSSFTFGSADMDEKARITCELMIEGVIVSFAEISFIDINDSIVSGIKPSNPTEGLLWINTTKTPNMLEKYINGQWVELGELDTEVSEKISALDKQMDDMVSDNTVTAIERRIVKDRLMEITGQVIADTAATLPTAASLDSSLKGAFYAVRKSAQYAGIETNDARYVALATNYTSLKTYLESLTPVKPWDTSEPRQDLSISVDRAVWRNKWLQYQLAYEDLQAYIQQKQKENVDNLNIGARNYIRNARLRIRDESGNLTSWSANPDWDILEPEEDKPTSNIMHIKQTGNTSNVYHAFISNKTGAKKDDIFTLSYDFKVASVAGLDTKTLGVLEFYDSTGTRILYHNIYIEDTKETLVDNTWVRITYTMTATLDDITSVAARFDLFKNGEIFIREPQLEKGQKATDYKDAPEDEQGQVSVLQERVTNVEQNTTQEAIVNAVTQSETYYFDMSQKADADKLGDYATKDEMQGAVDAAGSYTDDQIAGIDFTPYAKSSEVEQTVDALKQTFGTSGGINMLRNSISYAGTSFWELINGNIQSITNSEIEQLGFTRAWYSPAGVTSKLEQTVYTTIGQTYTIAFLMNVRSGSQYAGIDLVNQLGDNVTFLGKSVGAITNGYEKFEFTFTAETSQHTISINIESSMETVITALMLNIGERALQWSMHPEENYNLIVQSDLNGLKVNRIEDGQIKGFTRMSSDRFAGYYDVNNNGTIDEGKNSPDEVFRVDGEEFVQKKAVVKEEITMGTIKVVKIKSSTFQGWAFVSNEDDEG